MKPLLRLLQHYLAAAVGKGYPLSPEEARQAESRLFRPGRREETYQVYDGPYKTRTLPKPDAWWVRLWRRIKCWTGFHDWGWWYNASCNTGHYDEEHWMERRCSRCPAKQQKE